MNKPLSFELRVASVSQKTLKITRKYPDISIICCLLIIFINF